MARITQSVVAARAGVSGATVSRAIHGDPSVLPETREHVLNICRQLGYKPSIAARHLSQGGKAVVGLSLGGRDHAESRYVSLMHQALSAELAASSWSVRMISRADFNDKLDIGGLILLGVLAGDPRLETRLARRVPTIAIGHDTGRFCVAPDDAAGGVLAAEHLISTGRTRLATLFTHETDGSISLRIKSFCDAVRKEGLDLEMVDVPPSPTPSLQGYRAMARALSGARRFDGVFCETDEIALGAISALEDAQIAVPHEVGLVGFDDLPTLAHDLSTIRQDIPGIASAAINLLSEAKRGADPRSILTPVTMIRRKTS